MVPVLSTFYIQCVLELKKNNSVAKRLTDCQQPKVYHTRSQHVTLWARPSIRRNKILQPVLKIILTKLTTQTSKPACLARDQFQAPGGG